MKIDLTNIKNIIFDLGIVLLNLDFDRSIKAFHELGFNKDIIDNRQIFSDPVFYELSIGKISPNEFRDRIRELLQNSEITDKEIDEAWNAMILDIPIHRVEMLKKLQSRFEIFLFSNTNYIHIQKLESAFYNHHKIEFSSLFNEVFYSHEVQKYKPDVDSYIKIVELAGVDPSVSLFIDDLEPNVEGARKAGLNAFWLQDGMEITTILRSVI
ncbi:MAG: HAD family phosphatase [Prolixibacteraceae bacterium]|nr:HAD family phosphatase [Prolixibacteraceae bacterium]